MLIDALECPRVRKKQDCGYEVSERFWHELIANEDGME